MSIIPGSKFKIVDNCVVGKDVCFKISRITPKGILVWDTPSNGAEIETLITFDQIK